MPMFRDNDTITSCRVMSDAELASMNLPRENWPAGARPVLASYSDTPNQWVYWVKDETPVSTEVTG